MLSSSGTRYLPSCGDIQEHCISATVSAQEAVTCLRVLCHCPWALRVSKRHLSCEETLFFSSFHTKQVMCCFCSKENCVDFAAVDLWDGERMFEMPSVTSISQLHCAGRAESKARTLVTGHMGQAWLCMAGIVPQLPALVCCSSALGCRNQEYFMHDRHFPLWDQAVSMDSEQMCFSLAAPLCPLLLFWYITGAAGSSAS